MEKYQYSLHSGEKKCEVCQTHYYTWDCDTKSILWDENTPIITQVNLGKDSQTTL